MHLPPLLIHLLCLLSALLPVAAQECSATKKCATGCCSKFGFCGTDEAHCGDGCLSTCDFKLGCDASNPCADGTCCSKFGFCGFGKDFCAPENCVAGCDAKSQCDPGTYGADYVELQKCPLNVCCSKFGYCGSTSEFCGSKTVRRPSCAVDSSTTMGRVVGYYEGWAARRLCQAYMPEDVPLGVYTHLNFAFASIDPNTYHIVPAQDEDIPLYTKLTDLKKEDSSLKVFIAIGGWTFNDPGPTFRTFSELAADESKQKVFFASLISFMNTYNFDGVDLDWEYPVDSDRGGDKADFANYPKFVKNLKAALNAGSGGRNGLSLTVPVSFWYLQNFDIVELAKWADFFNVMSYDLHGLWDKGNKWLGPFLNSHTNMTEITEYLDLFWRNDISPSKITLGLAFYSRTFVAADAGCTKAQCIFDSVGEAGPCSQDSIGGTLTNAELTDKIRDAGVTPTLDEDAMVKVAVIGRTWITYDDEDTFKLKTDAARKLCLGGVMVWAVSQDYVDKTAGVAAAVGKRAQPTKRATGIFDTRYSLQLQSATKYKSLKAITVERETSQVDEPTPKIVRNQCFWTNCGEGCPSDAMAVPRLDNDGHKNEVMQDSYNCQGGTLRNFCCPNGKTIPKCGWFDFFNGKCGKHGACPAGSEDIVAPSDQQREVGSTQVACNNGKAQVACCQTENDSGAVLDSMRGYDMCKWFGTAPNSCDAAGAVEADNLPRSEACKIQDSDRPNYKLETYWGSGATHCRNKAYGSLDQYRPLCCKVDSDDAQWRNCRKVYADRMDGNFCQARCPAGTMRLAMEKPEVYENCKGGGHSICCEPAFLTEANNADEVHQGYVSALHNVLDNPGLCNWDAVEESISSATSKRQSNYLSFLDCKVSLQGTLNMLGSSDIGIRQKYTNDWNRAIEELGMPGSPASRMANYPTGFAFSTAPAAPVQTDIVQLILGSAKSISNNGGPSAYTWNCPESWYWDSTFDYSTDPDDGGEEEITPDYLGAGQIPFRRDVNSGAADSGDVHGSGGGAPGEAAFDSGSNSVSDSGFDSGYDSGSDSGSDSKDEAIRDRAEIDWEAALIRLRKFRPDFNMIRRGFSEHPKRTEVDMDDMDDETCQQTPRCRAHRMGYDISKPDDRKAFIEATADEPWLGPKRYKDIFDYRQRRKEIREKTEAGDNAGIASSLEERDSQQQMGAPRIYTVRSGRYSRNDWPGEIIESSPYPNGNQGDDLLDEDDSDYRYVVKSTGCGPSGYTLLTNADKSDVNGIWVSEHILELNTIGKFITASLDGGIGGIAAPIAVPGVQFPGGGADLDQARKFTSMFGSWSDISYITPADACLAELGSIVNTIGLVVCDSGLNQLKTSIYKLKNPVGDTRWDTMCRQSNPESLERAFSYLQGIMAVFDYYDDENVKSRHKSAYGAVMTQLQSFEIAYQREVGLNIIGEWQDRWNFYMNAHLYRVVTFARIWLQNKLDDLATIWQDFESECLLDILLRASECLYAAQALFYIYWYKSAIDSGRIDFDTSIFDV